MPNYDNQERPASVPYFIHEGVIAHMEQANERLATAHTQMAKAHRQMLIALISVCIALVIAIGVFVVGYTINNKEWIRYAENLTERPVVEEHVQSGEDHSD